MVRELALCIMYSINIASVKLILVIMFMKLYYLIIFEFNVCAELYRCKEIIILSWIVSFLTCMTFNTTRFLFVNHIEDRCPSIQWVKCIRHREITNRIFSYLIWKEFKTQCSLTHYVINSMHTLMLFYKHFFYFRKSFTD